jgi:outer membrane protein assembly factor BamB
MLTKNGGHIPVGNFWLDSAMAVGDDGTLYFCAVDSRLMALSSDGHLKWEFKTKTHSVNHASPVIAVDGTIYFASGDGNLYAVRPDGAQKWAFDAESGAFSATPVLAEDETIFVVNDGGLFAVSSEGKLLANGIVGGSVASSPTIATDGTIYAAGRAGKIVAFSGGHGGLLNSAWPKFQAGPANSGRARGF